MNKNFKLLLTDEYGHICNGDGSLYRTDSGQPEFEYYFSTLDAAKHYCEQAVRDHPHLLCEVSDDRCVVFRHSNPEWYRAEKERIRQLFAAKRKRDRIRVTGIIVVIVSLVAGIILFLKR